MSERHKALHHKHLHEHIAHSDRKHDELRDVVNHAHGLIHATLERHNKQDVEIETRHAKEHAEAHDPNDND